MQKRSVRREVSLHQRSPFQSTSAALGDLLSCSGTSPSGRMIRNETYTTLMRQMAELSDSDREVLVLRHMEQLTNGEVAHVLGIGKAAATKRYLRALQRLRHATAHLATS